MPKDKSESQIVVTFHPQAWVRTSAKQHEPGRKQLVPAEERDPVSFTIPWKDGADPDGTVFEDESYEANQLRDRAEASDWVNDWEGPYFVTLESE